MKIFYLLFLICICSVVSASAQQINTISTRCPSPNRTSYSSVRTDSSGNITYIPCPSGTSIFTGNVDFSGATVTGLSGGGGGAVIDTATTYYVCPSGLSNCAYNGDGGQAATPSDANSCLTKALPCATIAGARAKIANTIVNAVVTFQLADTTGGTCYLPNAVSLNQATRGGSTNIFDVVLDGATNDYPESYIYVKGNLSAPTNVAIVGATTCGGAVPSTYYAFKANFSNLRVAGVQFKYFRAGAITANNRGLVYVETTSAFSIPDQFPIESGNQSIVSAGQQSDVHFGGNITSVNYGIVAATGASTVVTNTPVGNMNLSYTGTGATYPDFAFLINEKSHLYLEGASAVFLGTGTYVAYGALIGSTINWNSDTITNNTVNGANITFLKARQGGYISETCGATDQNCTFTSMLRRAWADDDAIITLGPSTGFGTSGNLLQNGGMVKQMTTFPYTNMYLPTITALDRQLVVGYQVAGSSSFHNTNIALTRSRGTLASPSIVSSADDLGTFNFSGHDGTTFLGSVRIGGVVDGTPGTNDMPGRFYISTTADGAASPTERVRVNNAGITSLYYGGSVASAASIVPTGNSFTLTGTATVATISTTNIQTGTTINIICGTTAAFDESGNIDVTNGTGLTCAAGNLVITTWDGTKWRLRGW